MLFLIIYILHENFCVISFIRTQDVNFTKNSRKIVFRTSPSMFVKTISISSFKESILHAKFCMIPCNRVREKIIIRILEKYSSARYRAICTQIASLLFLMVYNLCIKFCAFSFRRNRDQRIPKILQKVLLQRNLSRNFHQKLMDINLC